jgi:hypothetical protein
MTQCIGRTTCNTKIVHVFCAFTLLCILLGCKFSKYLYLLIVFLWFIDVCFVVMFHIFIFVVSPILPKVFIHHCFKFESVVMLGCCCIFVCLLYWGG